MTEIAEAIMELNSSIESLGLVISLSSLSIVICLIVLGAKK